MRSLIAAAILGMREARLVYPLVRCANPSTDMARWLDHAREIVRRSPRESGLVGARDKRGLIHGVFSYRVVPDLAMGQLARIGDFVVGSLPGLDARIVLELGVELMATHVRLDAVAVERPVALVGGGFDSSLSGLIGRKIAEVALLAGIGGAPDGSPLR